MAQWEYCKIDLNNPPRRADDIDLLDEVGEQAWELVAIVANRIAYLKRRVEDPQQPAAPRRKISQR